MADSARKYWACSSVYILYLFVSNLLVMETAGQGLNWDVHEDIRTGRKVWDNMLMTSSDVPPQISYNITYSSPLTGTRNAGIGITGFQTIITNDFSINSTIQNFTISWMRISVGVLDTTVATHLAINWIAVGDTVDFLQVLFDCYFCTTMSIGNGTRSQTRTDTTFFQGYSQLFVTVYLAGFRVHNSEGITNYLAASANIETGTNVIDYTFQTNENNTVVSICYTTLVFCQQITQILYYDWGEMGQEELSNPGGVTPSVFNPPNRYEEEDKMFFGMSAFNLSRAMVREFDMDTQEYATLGTTYLDNVGTYNIMMDYFWIAVRNCNDNGNDRWLDMSDLTNLNCVNDNGCPADTFETEPGRFCGGCHYSCSNCSGAHRENCTSCDMTMFRDNLTLDSTCPCQERYIDVGVSLCHPCEYYMPGCETCSSTTLCTDCFPGFTLDSSGQCGCTSGYLVTGVCTNITGCTSAVQFGGTVYCVACDSTLNYQPSGSYTCSCMAAYYQSANQLCLSDCGDGLQASDEECDDGNTASGDGCSSSCSVETNWACFNGSTTSASYCLISNGFTMTVKYVQRVLNSNVMRVGIKISPQYDQFTEINFKQLMSHDVPADEYNATYEDGMLILDFAYTRTIEGEDFTASFTFDPDIFYNTTVSVAIPASGMNAKLTYDSNTSLYEPLGIIVIVLDLLAIIVLGASALSQRMIGIEMIQTLQTCLFVQMVVKTMPSSLAPLQNLQYSNGYNDMMGDDPARTFTFAFSLSSVGLQKQFLLSFNIMFIILLIVVGVNIILKAKQIYHENKAEKIVDDEEYEKNQIKWQKTTKIFYFMFERVLFVVGFMCMFIVIAALMVQITDMSADYQMMPKELNMLAGGVAIVIIGTLLCCAIINGIYPPTLLFPMLVKQYYPPIYFIYQSSFIFICCFMYTQEYILYILAFMSLAFMIYNIAHRPYPERFHAFVLVFHQIVILCVILLFIFEIRTSPTEHQSLYTIAAIAIIVALYIIVFLNAYRLYRYRKFLKEKNWDQYGNDLDEIEENGGLGLGLGAVLANKASKNNGNYQHLKTKRNHGNDDSMNDEEYEQRRQEKLKKKEEKEEKERQRARKKQQKKERRAEEKKKKKLEQLQDEKNKKREKKYEKEMKELDQYYKKPKDEKDYQWKVNKLAEDGNNNERVKGTNRDAYPDTSREKDDEQVNNYGKSNKNNQELQSNKTVKNLLIPPEDSRQEKNRSDEDESYKDKRQRERERQERQREKARKNQYEQDDDEYYGRSNKPSSRRNNGKDEEEESDAWRSPYDENGNVKDKNEEDLMNKSKDGKEVDPLKILKMKLRQDFSNKLKGSSTMRDA